MYELKDILQNRHSIIGWNVPHDAINTHKSNISNRSVLRQRIFLVFRRKRVIFVFNYSNLGQGCGECMQIGCEMKGLRIWHRSVQ